MGTIMRSTSCLIIYAIPIFPSKLIYLSPLPFFAAFSKNVEIHDAMKATLAHSYMYQ